MSNTGKQIVISLKEINVATGVATGQTKNNTVGDPNYIPPAENLTACPVTYTTDCPSIAATAQAGQIEFEFSLPAKVYNNPAIKRVRVNVLQSTSVIGYRDYTLPHTPVAFFHGTVDTLPANTYSINILYLDINGGTLHTCTFGSTTYTTT